VKYTKRELQQDTYPSSTNIQLMMQDLMFSL